MIRTILVAYAGTALVFCALDAGWLMLTSAALYRPTLAPILTDQPRLVPAVLFYVIYLAGVVLFAVTPPSAPATGPPPPAWAPRSASSPTPPTT